MRISDWSSDVCSSDLVITMIGGVTLTQGGNTVNGGRLTITLDTGRAVIDGAAMAGGSTGAAGSTTPTPGRVTGRFSVPARRGDTRDCSGNRRAVPPAAWADRTSTILHTKP